MAVSTTYDKNSWYWQDENQISDTKSNMSEEQISSNKNKKYNYNGPLAFKSQRVGYQTNKKLLHHYYHAKNQLNS